MKKMKKQMKKMKKANIPRGGQVPRLVGENGLVAGGNL